MTSKQILLFLFTLIIVSVLFYLGYKSPVAKLSGGEANIKGKEFNFENYLVQSRSKIPVELNKKIQALEKDSAKEENLLEVSRLWDSLHFPLIASSYAFHLAEKRPNEQNWIVAGSKYYRTAEMSNDSGMMLLAASKSKQAFEKVLLINPDNLDAKNALGLLYIQVNNDIMKGVALLKEILVKDSDNVQAILSLGLLSIQSGQLDKAEQRFKKLISLQPFNPEYYYYLAEVYAKSGRKEEAIKTYEMCKSILKDAKAKKEIDDIIKQLKNT